MKTFLIIPVLAFSAMSQAGAAPQHAARNLFETPVAIQHESQSAAFHSGRGIWSGLPDRGAAVMDAAGSPSQITVTATSPGGPGDPPTVPVNQYSWALLAAGLLLAGLYARRFQVN